VNSYPQRKSSLLLGATIITVELPTAFPYLAAIAAIAGSRHGVPGQLLLLAVYNLCFELPLIAILTTLLLAGDQAQPLLTRARDFVQRHWPLVLAGLLLLGGLLVALLGATRLATRRRGHSGAFH